MQGDATQKSIFNTVFHNTGSPIPAMTFTIEANASRIRSGEAPKLASAFSQATENAQLIGFVRPEIKNMATICAHSKTASQTKHGAIQTRRNIKKHFGPMFHNAGSPILAMTFTIEANASRIRSGEAPKLASTFSQATENAQLIGFVPAEIKNMATQGASRANARPHRNQTAPGTRRADVERRTAGNRFSSL